MVLRLVRFVLSAGHGCMLLYALLHLAGYNNVLASDHKDSIFFDIKLIVLDFTDKVLDF